MATPLSDIARLADEAIGGEPPVRGLAETARFVARALARLNDVAPYEAEIEIVGDGTDEYDLPAPWDPSGSVITRVERYTDGDYDEPAEDLDQSEYRVGRDADGDPILRLTDALATDDELVVYATVPHTLTASATTLDARHWYALADLAAALKLEAAAARLCGVQPQGTDDDLVVGMEDRAGLLRSQASALRKRFDEHFGVTPSATGGPQSIASVAIDVDPPTPWPGRRWHTHDRRRS